MKKFRIFKNKLIALLNLISADEFYLQTYEHKEGSKYNQEFRTSFTVPRTLTDDINYVLFEHVSTAHKLKAMQVNLEKAKELLK